jgi:ATP-dependent Clp protease adaptor protein ClpS
MTEKHSPKQSHKNTDTELYKIVLYNDNVHTFDFVIDMLMRYCNHSLYQAEQCAMLTHFKGKSVVKKGTYEKLLPVASTLMEKGLSVDIE